MKLSDLLGAGLSAMTAHKFRSLLTLLGVMLGSLLLFCSISGGLGVVDAVNKRLAAGDRLLEVNVTSGVLTDDVTVAKAKAAGFVEEMSDERRIRLAEASGVGGVIPVPMNLAASEKLASIENVDAAWSRLRFNSSVYLESVNRWAMGTVRSIPPKNTDYSTVMVLGKSVSSAPIPTSSESSGNRGVLVSELFLYQQGIRTDAELSGAIGSSLQITTRNSELENSSNTESSQRRQKAIESLPFRSQSFRIRGIFRFPTREESREEPDLVQLYAVSVLLPYADAVDCWRGLGLGNNNTSAVALAKSPEGVAQIEAEIGEMGYRTRSLAEVAMQIRTAVLLITLIITAIAAAALLISALGITNTMVMNVLERRKDIAVMKAIGARDSDLKRLFLIEGFLVGLFGGVGGLVLGVVLSRFCGDWIRNQLEKRLDHPFYGDIFAYPIWLCVGTPLVAAMVTMLASYLPARRAAKIDPAQTLRGL